MGKYKYSKTEQQINDVLKYHDDELKKLKAARPSTSELDRRIQESELMQQDIEKMQLFYEYYKQWIDVYKKGAIREATMAKYLMTQKWVEKLAPNLKISELTRTAYQKLLNDYAKDHERQTTLDFHHQLKGAILDAVDEGLIERDPTRKQLLKVKHQE